VPEMSTEGNTVWYTISNTRSVSGKYLYWTEAGLKDANTLSKASLFYFTAGGSDTCYIHNAATDLLFTGDGAWSTEGVGCVISETPHSSKAGVAIEFNGTALNEQNHADGFTTWSANDAGSIFVISPVVATIKEAVAKIEENKAAGNTIFGQYKYEEESYNALVAALAVLESAEGEEFFAAFESSAAVMASLVLAMPEEGKFYVIECPLFKQVQGVSKALNSTPGWNTLNLTDKNYYWTVEVNDGSYALKNVATGKYLNGTSMSDAPAYAKLNSLGQQQFNIVVNGTTVHANNHGSGKNASGNIVSWGGEANSASAWQFIERVDPATLVEATVTYSFTYEGEEKYTQTTTTLLGEEWPAITVAFPYGVSASKPEGVVEVEEEEEVAAVEITKVIELEVAELPFVAAETVEGISKWYYAAMHTNYPRYIQENAAGGIDFVKQVVGEVKTDSLLWGFVGNHFDGIKLVNKATGHAVVSTGGDAQMGDAANATVFALSASDTQVENGFCLKYPGGGFLNGNAGAGKVSTWSYADAGSTFLLYTLPKEELTAFAAKFNELESLTEACPSMYAMSAVQNQFFAVYDAVAPVKEAIENGTATSEEVVAATASMTEVIAFVLAMDAKYNEWMAELMACYEVQDTTVTENVAAIAAFAAVVDKHSMYQWMMPAESVEDFDALIAELVAARESFIAAANTPMTPEMEAFLAKYGELEMVTETCPSLWFISVLNEKFYELIDAGDALKAKLLTATAEELSAFGVLVDEFIAFAQSMDAKYNEWKTELMACYEVQDTTTTASEEAVAAFAEVLEQHSSYQWSMPATSVEEIDALIAELVAARKAFVDDATGINNINVNVEAVIYDIHGRRVSTMEKGIYIVNGRKVIVK
ncbi:MAG: RICIN domain-containing protein, partial [Bacteroidaceae bacterium]|nr:RICIN domain-containing protein [Bacteroidaceae bacterium]